jgi:hypothetical protein
MATNKKAILEPGDQSAADWFELFNPNPGLLDLSGFYVGLDLT